MALPSRDMRRQSVRRSVANYIKELIFDGKLVAGDRVPQDDVALALDVSNTPVREALIALEHEGLVTAELHRGAFVNGFDTQSVRDQYELFALVWGWAVRRAVERSTSDQADRLLELGRMAKATDDVEAVYDIMTAVSDLLQEVSGSRDWRRLLDRLPRLVPGPAFYRIPGAMSAVTDWLEPLAIAIRQGNIDDALAASDRMMYEHGDALLEELDRRHLIATAAP
jgi:DNA-binding GntR family transcriptional regulator